MSHALVSAVGTRPNGDLPPSVVMRAPGVTDKTKAAPADTDHHLNIEVRWRDRMARHVATRCRVSLSIAGTVVDLVAVNA
jgi:hypothetical protein